MTLGKTISFWSLNFLIYTMETGALLPDYPFGLRIKWSGATRVLVGGAPLGMSREAGEGKWSQFQQTISHSTCIQVVLEWQYRPSSVQMINDVILQEFPSGYKREALFC